MRLIAVDWGTTNRRVFILENGEVRHTERDAGGVLAVRDFAADVAGLRERFGDAPMLLAGMIGSTIGWREAPYVPAPAGADELAGALLVVDPATAIVPGASTREPPDVMRGEEVQLVGAVAAGLAPADALLVQPGTHCKWATMAAGRITGFTTAMTGELFAMLREHSLLAPQLRDDVVLGPSFLEGVEQGSRRDLAASLFGIRAAKLLGARDDAEAASYASGLLIGSDVAARLAESEHREAFVLADPALGGLYAAAIEACGGRAHVVDSHASFVAGILEIAGRWIR